MHDLQRVFASAEGEAAWTQDMHALFGAGAFDEAEVQLAEALAALDTELAWICLALPREAVVLSGWEEMSEAIALHEGDPVTGVTIAIANETDRDFERGQFHRPYVMLGIYTDEAFAFSQAFHWELLDQCHADLPAWAGKEEDIEVHMDIDGLDLLNTRLAHHKHRHFFRDEVNGAAPALAPRPYIEFVLGCWWRALRWHQAVATECTIHGLPRAIPVVAGMVDMRPDAVAIHDTGRVGAGESGGGRSAPRLTLVRSGVASLADSFGDHFIQRKPLDLEPAPPTALELRRLAREERKADGDVLERPAAVSLWARIFGRR